MNPIEIKKNKHSIAIFEQMNEWHEHTISSHLRYMVSRSCENNVINIAKPLVDGILGQILELQ